MQEERKSTLYPSECKQGCGFYGSSQFDGYCSKCYKDLFPGEVRDVSKSTSNRLTSTPTTLPSTSATHPSNSNPSMETISISRRSSPAYTLCGDSSPKTTSEDELLSTPSTTTSPENVESGAMKTLPHEELFLKRLCALGSSSDVSVSHSPSATTWEAKANSLQVLNSDVPTPQISNPSSPMSGSPVTDECLSLDGSPSLSPKVSNSPIDKMCAQCNRKFVVGFKCRCEKFFCTKHRNHDKHNCTFDYKSSERDKIAAMNPTVMRGKIEKF